MLKEYKLNKSLLLGDHVETIEDIKVSNNDGVCEVEIMFKDPNMDVIQFKAIEGLDNWFPDLMASQLANCLQLENKYVNLKTREQKLFATTMNEVIREMPKASQAKCEKEITARMRLATADMNATSFPNMVAVFEKAKEALVGTAVLCTGKISAKTGNPYMAIAPIRG